MKRRYVAALAVSGTLLMGAGTAVAASYPTTITHDSRTLVAPNTYVDSGRVESPKRVCEVLRVVTVIIHEPYAERPRVVDYDLTSYFGAWATRGNFAGASNAKARVPRRTFRRGGNRITCQSAFVRLF